MKRLRTNHRVPRRNDSTSLSNSKSPTPSEQALLFAVYYAAVVSLEEEEVTTSFGVKKSELVSKYRTGLEASLACADFLNKPDILIVQALCIFLNLVMLFLSLFGLVSHF